jgi:hypothetical protein
MLRHHNIGEMPGRALNRLFTVSEIGRTCTRAGISLEG